MEFFGNVENICKVANSVYSADFLFIFCAKINRVLRSTSVRSAEYVVRTESMESHSKCQNSFLVSDFGKNFILSEILI